MYSGDEIYGDDVTSGPIDPPVITINLEPDWNNLLRFEAIAFVEHGYEKGAYAAMASFLEIAVKVFQDNPEQFRKIIAGLDRKNSIIFPMREKV